MTAYKVSGLADSALDKYTSGTGGGDNPTSGATSALTQADEVGFAAIFMEEQTDEKGTWVDDASHVYDSDYDQENGTSGQGGASNISVFSSAEILSATTAQEAEQTSTGGNDWGAAIATYKVSVGGEPSIENTPPTWSIGTVYISTDYWANGSEPSWPLDDGECEFSVTNGSGAAVDIDIKATNFTGGVGWTLASSAGQNIVVLKAGVSGAANEGAFIILTTSDQELITSLADSGTEYWELMMESATSHTDGVGKTSTVTITASLSS